MSTGALSCAMPRVCLGRVLIQRITLIGLTSAFFRLNDVQGSRCALLRLLGRYVGFGAVPGDLLDLVFGLLQLALVRDQDRDQGAKEGNAAVDVEGGGAADARCREPAADDWAEYAAQPANAGAP